MNRTTCSACGYDDLDTFLDLGFSPVADAYTDGPDVEVEQHPLQVAVCNACHLVQLREMLDGHTLFGTGYSFYSSASAPLSTYHREYAASVIRRYGETFKNRLVVEVGCNDGDLLRHFTEHAGQVLGVDPAAGPADVAIRRGLSVHNVAFGKAVAELVRDESGPAALVVANHVLAHVESVSDVLSGISNLLAVDGLSIIEVQYLPDLLVNNAFDLVYHEHRNFFSLSTLTAAAALHGLHVVDAELTDRQGGSLRAVLARRPQQPTNRLEAIKRGEQWLRSGVAYAGVQGRVDRIVERLRQVVYEYGDEGNLVGYGAPAKATTLLNVCGFTQAEIRYVVDSTPAKQGRYIPGAGIPIMSREDVDLDQASSILLLAWNYARTIMRKERFSGDWIIPIPAPVVL